MRQRKARPGGLEPPTCGLEVRDHNDVTANPRNELREDGDSQVPSMVPSPSNSESKGIADQSDEPGLAYIISCWPDLPLAIQAGIVAMVKSWFEPNE
jgi:hypothetical protein